MKAPPWLQLLKPIVVGPIVALAPSALGLDLSTPQAVLFARFLMSFSMLVVRERKRQGELRAVLIFPSLSSLVVLRFSHCCCIQCYVLNKYIEVQIQKKDDKRTFRAPDDAGVVTSQTVRAYDESELKKLALSGVAVRAVRRKDDETSHLSSRVQALLSCCKLSFT